MRKRWGVRVIAILMLIAGLMLFLLGVAPPVLMALRGTGGGLVKYLAIPSVLGGCMAAFPLLVVGSVLLTLGRIADNFAPVAPPAPAKSSAPAATVVVSTPQAAASEQVGSEPVVAVVAAPEADQGRAEETPSAAAVIAGAAAVTTVAEERTGGEAELLPETEPPIAGTLAGATIAQDETRPPHEEVNALQAQLAALQAQLDEMEGAAPGSPRSQTAPPAWDELPAAMDDEGPAPGATTDLTLPGRDEAARVAAEMAALGMGAQTEAPQEH